MVDNLNIFEKIVRRSEQFTDNPSGASEHPFQSRNIHGSLPEKCRLLFDDGHYSESSFEAFKYLDKHIQKLSGETNFGKKLMMSVFGGAAPKLALNGLKTQSDRDEQEGYQFIFAGVMSAIRNPKGHDFNIKDDPDTCLDYLVWVSSLIRRLERSGIKK